jgi:hypothetical protein
MIPSTVLTFHDVSPRRRRFCRNKREFQDLYLATALAAGWPIPPPYPPGRLADPRPVPWPTSKSMPFYFRPDLVSISSTHVRQDLLKSESSTFELLSATIWISLPAGSARPDPFYLVVYPSVGDPRVFKLDFPDPSPAQAIFASWSLVFTPSDPLLGLELGSVFLVHETGLSDGSVLPYAWARAVILRTRPDDLFINDFCVVAVPSGLLVSNWLIVCGEPALGPLPP